MSDDALTGAAAALIKAFGACSVDLTDPELRGSAERVAELWQSNLLSGHQQTPAEVLAESIEDSSGGVVSVLGVPFHGVCPHHLLPYFGIVHLAYEPNGRIVGFGRLERLVAACSRRLILQERLTRAIPAALIEHLGAQGAACAVESTQLCLILQGREPRSSRVRTAVYLGSLSDRYEVLPPAPRIEVEE